MPVDDVEEPLCELSQLRIGCVQQPSHTTKRTKSLRRSVGGVEELTLSSNRVKQLSAQNHLSCLSMMLKNHSVNRLSCAAAVCDHRVTKLTHISLRLPINCVKEPFSKTSELGSGCVRLFLQTHVVRSQVNNIRLQLGGSSPLCVQVLLQFEHEAFQLLATLLRVAAQRQP